MTYNARPDPFRTVINRFLALYFLAILASWAWQWIHPQPLKTETLNNLYSIELPAIKGDAALSYVIRMAFYDIHPEIGKLSPDRPAIILLHGSPGSGNGMRHIQALLDPSYRVIMPDLPGFGHSSEAVPDSSNAAHARYVLDLMHTLKIPQAHVVGYSGGGAVALYMQQLEPRRVTSIVMLSAIGAQELQWTGHYWLNRIVQFCGIGAYSFAQYGVPHFGWIDEHANIAMSRNLYDSDQRPLRSVLEHYEGPMLIIHGLRDENVMFRTAVEHHRVVPQSELAVSNDDHFMTFMRPDYLALKINQFVRQVDSGQATTKKTENADRLAAAGKPFRWEDRPPLRGLVAYAGFGLLTLSTLLSEEVASIIAGYLGAMGILNAFGALASVLLGVFVFAVLVYMFARWLHPWMDRFGLWNRFCQSADPPSDAFAAAFKSSRFPVYRVLIYLRSGAHRVSFHRYLAANFIASAISVIAFAGIGFIVAVFAQGKL